MSRIFYEFILLTSFSYSSATEQPATTTAAAGSKPQPQLKVFNTFTMQKDVFVPNDVEKKLVTWYMCGPTVYDYSHMGHAKCYVVFDILARLLTDYFGYNLKLAMNITDIDDKIIMRAK